MQGGSHVCLLLLLLSFLFFFCPSAPKNSRTRLSGSFKESVVFVLGGGNYSEYQNLQDWQRESHPHSGVQSVGQCILSLASARCFLPPLLSFRIIHRGLASSTPLRLIRLRDSLFSPLFGICSPSAECALLPASLAPAQPVLTSSVRALRALDWLFQCMDAASLSHLNNSSSSWPRCIRSRKPLPAQTSPSIKIASSLARCYCSVSLACHCYTARFNFTNGENFSNFKMQMTVEME